MRVAVTLVGAVAALGVLSGASVSNQAATARIGVVIDGDTFGLYGGERVRLLRRHAGGRRW